MKLVRGERTQSADFAFEVDAMQIGAIVVMSLGRADNSHATGSTGYH